MRIKDIGACITYIGAYNIYWRSPTLARSGYFCRFLKSLEMVAYLLRRNFCAETLRLFSMYMYMYIFFFKFFLGSVFVAQKLLRRNFEAVFYVHVYVYIFF